MPRLRPRSRLPWQALAVKGAGIRVSCTLALGPAPGAAGTPSRAPPGTVVHRKRWAQGRLDLRPRAGAPSTARSACTPRAGPASS